MYVCASSHSDSGPEKKQREQRDKEDAELPLPGDSEARDTILELKKREKKMQDDRNRNRRQMQKDAEKIRQLKAELESAKKVKEKVRVEELTEDLGGACSWMNEAQRRAVDFFNKMRKLDIITLQFENHYQNSNMEENRRRLEAGRHYHHNRVSTRLKWDHPRFSELSLIWIITGKWLNPPLKMKLEG